MKKVTSILAVTLFMLGMFSSVAAENNIANDFIKQESYGGGENGSEDGRQKFGGGENGSEDGRQKFGGGENGSEDGRQKFGGGENGSEDGRQK